MNDETQNTPSPVPLLRADEAAIEHVAKALALDMYPDTRWPRDEDDANSGVDDREGCHPVSWHYANKCRSQARVAIRALAQASEGGR